MINDSGELTPGQVAFSAFNTAPTRTEFAPEEDIEALPEYTSTHIDDLPKEMTEAKGWLAWRVKPRKGKKPTKPPVEAGWNESTLTLAEARKKYPHDPLGLAFNGQHDLIGIDVDGVDIKHPRIQELLAITPTIIDRSPSGKDDRYHLYYILEGDRTQLPAKQAQVDETLPIELYNTSTNYLAVTGQLRPESARTIGTITVAQLHKLFPKSVPKIIDMTTRQPVTGPDVSQAVDLATWIDQVPVHESDPDVQKLMKKKGWNHYDYWLIGLMSLKMRGGTTADGMVWSEKDEEKYDQQDFLDTWNSIDTGDGTHQGMYVTVSTYQMYFNMTIIDWPKRVGNKPEGSPVATDVGNYLKFLEHNELSWSLDDITGEILLTGPDSVIYPAIYKNPEILLTHKLSPDFVKMRMTMLPRKLGFEPSMESVAKWNEGMVASVQDVGTTNIYRDAMRSVVWDGQDRIQWIVEEVFKFHEMTGDELALTKRMLYKWILSLARSLVRPELAYGHKEKGTEGVLILQSESTGIGKSSFGKLLLPEMWRLKLYKQAIPDFSSTTNMHQYKREVLSALQVDWDEVDQITKGKYNAQMKAYLTAESDTTRFLFKDMPLQRLRNYSIMASTNKMQLSLPTEGLRRFWPIKIAAMDISLLIAGKIDQVQLLAQACQQLIMLSNKYPKERAPWHLNKSEKKIHNDMIPSAITQNDLEHALEYYYDWTPEGFARRIEESKAPNGRLTKSAVLTPPQEICNELFRLSNGRVSAKPSALRNSLMRLLKTHDVPVLEVGNLRPVTGGIAILSGKKTGYFLPAELQAATFDGDME